MMNVFSKINLTAYQWRLLTQTGFFLLFFLAPPLDILRFDLDLGQFILFGSPLSLNVTPETVAAQTYGGAALNVLLRVLLPIFLFVTVGGYIVWRYGRLYCGWLCPHFSIVETINRLMVKQLGTPSIWDKGKKTKHSIFGWLVVVFVAWLFASVWAVAFLGYLVNPWGLYQGMMDFSLPRWQWIFLCAATLGFMSDFLFARHIFCKYGCALGVFQSVIWMANGRSMEIEFDRSRATACQNCSSKACDKKCPMRLPTRSIKRRRFACTQCGECIEACHRVQDREGLLKWVEK